MFINDHVEDFKLMPYNHIAIFLQGSQNYKMNYEDSDVDTKALIAPTLDDIVRAKTPVSFTNIRSNNEHIDIKDIRIMMQQFLKQNVNFIEILFTDYYYVFPNYEKEISELRDIREEIAQYYIERILKSIKGMTYQKRTALQHPYPSLLDKLEKFGYDPKQLHHILRLHDFLLKYLKGMDYKDCLIPDDTEYLISVKKGYYDCSMAVELADRFTIVVEDLCDKYIEEYSPQPNKKVEDKILEIQTNIIKNTLKRELIR